MDEYNPRICPVCGEEFNKDDMLWTYDCYGIPYRLVCDKCYGIVMRGRDYDGELYTELDENVWGDY